MSSQLQKILLTYDQINDRLILDFCTQDFCEYRFWITRRLLKGLWELLCQLHESMPKEQVQNMPDKKRAEQQIHREVQNPDANKYSTRVTKSPLGEQPLLLCKISATTTDRGVHFHLEDMQGHAVDFSGDAFLLILLTQLIAKVLPKTEWDLKLKSL